MAQRRAGILDVARLAGVSPATVSRSLRGLPKVSEPTRLRVLEAAAELAYVASPAASGLRSGRTGAVGVVVPHVTRWFFAQAVAGAERVLREAGFDVLLYNVGGRAGRERFLSAMPLHRRVDAVLVLTLPLDDAQADQLQGVGVPVVSIGTRSERFSSVRIDETETVRSAVRHLRLLGHERMTMVAGPPEDLDFVAALQRRRVFTEEVGDHGHGAPEVIVAGAPGLEGGAQAAERILSGRSLPTAVFAEYDELAFGALRTLALAGISVPGQVSVVGVDDHDMASVVDLTTVAQPIRQQGAAAARILLEDLAHGTHEPRDVVLPTRLVVRGSTAPPRLDT
ncbi:MAG TPA: LacI family DNA-binding transcriptional regulator [Actinomycetales bacterium]|nr:LacI family DNA-binding transcriptional regulator [Actinomycetales bacterium]